MERWREGGLSLFVYKANDRAEIGGDMTPGQLVRVVADVLGIPEATMVVYDRRLVAEGLRSKAGHGRGSAQVTVRDAAHLLTAVLGSAQVKDSAATVRRYTETRPEGEASTKKLYARRSTLLKWIDEQEKRGWPGNSPSPSNGKSDCSPSDEAEDGEDPEAQ